jgi:hypothetical protein
MAWMRLEDAVRDHPKIMEAAADLSIAKVQMIGHLVLLWTWALRNAPDGDLRGRSPRHIALVCEWTGDADAFVGVLQRCRMLDGNASDGTARVHDWMEYAAQYREAQRKANTRDAQPSEDKDGSSRPGKSRTVQESPRRRRRRRETKTDPEREDRARPDAAPAAEPDASDASATEAPPRPAGGLPVAKVEPEANDAPQPRGEASGAKVAPPPPVLVALVEPEPEDDPAGERTSGPISDDAFGAAEVVELYNAHRPAWLPAFDPDAEGDPVAKRRTLDDVVDVIRSERSAFRAATREGAALARPGLHTVEGWLAFCARLAAAPPIASFTPVPSLPAWVGGKSGERMRGKLWSGAYDDKHAPRETAMQRNVREAMERAVEARAEEPSWVGLLGAGGSAGR